MDQKLKHLEFIQNIIDRQARNSFLLKGWTITLVAALCALSLREVFKFSVLIYCLIFIFWMLDSYYLWQERLFRALYENIRNKEAKEIDFNLDTKNIKKEENCSFINTVTSSILIIFYASLMLFTILFFNLKP